MKALTDYANNHGADVAAFVNAGWVETKYNGYPALKFSTDGGDRYRIFGGDNKYAGKSKQAWYRLDEAIQLATELPLIIVNGEASVIAAQYHGLPATAVTMGEKRIPDELIAQLKEKYRGYYITVVFDNDTTGVDATGRVIKQLKEAGFTPFYVEWDEGLEKGYDFADYLRDNGAENTISFIEKAHIYIPASGTKTADTSIIQYVATGSADELVNQAIARTQEGSRNKNGYTLAMELRKMGIPKETALEYGLQYQKAVSDKGNTPYTESEMRNSIESAYNRPIETVIKVSGNTPKTIMPMLHELGYDFRYNDLNDEIEVNGEFLSDRAAKDYYAALANSGIDNERKIDLAVHLLAQANRFHPIKDYLNSLEWDGQDHIKAVAQCFIGPDDDANIANEIFFRRWLISVAAKTLDAKQNVMLVFSGPQGIGKSTFSRWLTKGIGEKYYIEEAIAPDDKDTKIRAISSWIWEVGELGSTTRKADIDALKRFITQNQIVVRKPYDRRDTMKPVSASYIGTVNDDGTGFLVDPTGNRRFMIVEVDKIDYAYQKVDVNQLWAQAVALYRAGEAYQLTEVEKELQRVINSKHEHISPIEDVIRERYEVSDSGKEYSTDIINYVLDLSSAYGNATTVSRDIGRIFTKMGAKRGQEKGTNRRYWKVKVRRDGVFTP